VLKTIDVTMRWFFTEALIGCGAFHVAFGQTPAKRSLTAMSPIKTSGMATGPTPTQQTIDASGTVTFSNTYASSNQGNGLGQCANGNPTSFTEFATGQSNSKGFLQSQDIGRW
jgi:hypothetical protein